MPDLAFDLRYLKYAMHVMAHSPSVGLWAVHPVVAAMTGLMVTGGNEAGREFLLLTNVLAQWR
jgi:hypothetical protein